MILLDENKNMSKKTILHFTGAISTKYGSFEKYSIVVINKCLKDKI